MKNTMMALMRRMMLSCEEATLLTTRKEVESIGMMRSINLQLHLSMCKHCRKFYKQSALLTQLAQKQVNVAMGRNVPLHRMSTEEKVRLQKLINNKIQKN